MGWGSGSSLANDLMHDITKSKKFSEDQREMLAKFIIENFENYDCDTLDEVRDKTFQKVFQQMRGSEEDV